MRRTVKILLLGSGESGKSTFLKQMRIIHGEKYGDGELLEFKPIIYSNIVKGMKVLIDARDKLNITWGDPSNEEHAKHVFAYDSAMRLDEPMFLQYLHSIRLLWMDVGIRRAFERRREFQLVCFTILITYCLCIYYTVCRPIFNLSLLFTLKHWKCFLRETQSNTFWTSLIESVLR